MLNNVEASLLTFYPFLMRFLNTVYPDISGLGTTGGAKIPNTLLENTYGQHLLHPLNY